MNPSISRWGYYWPLLLVFMGAFCQPLGVSIELMNLFMMILGGWYLWKRPASTHNPAIKLYTLIFATIWIPGWFSLPDAVDLERSLVTQIGYIRFYLAGIFVIFTLDSRNKNLAVAKALAFLLAFWMLDAWVQMLSGHNIFGMEPVHAGRISGLFGKKQILGWMILLYASVLGAVLIEHKKMKWLCLFVPIIIATIFLSGTRSAWVGSVWVSMVLVGVLLHWKIKPNRKVLLMALILVVAFFSMLFQQERFQDRLNHTKIINLDYETLDRVTSYRLVLWDTTLDLIKDNWVNGVGVKAFRYAYPAYASTNDPFVMVESSGRKKGAHHAHQIVLDTLAHNGLIGLFGLFLFFGILSRLFIKLLLLKEYLPMAYGLGVLGVLFPLNSHPSLFSSYWAQAVWFVIALMLASWNAYQNNPKNPSKTNAS
ncbi:MAG: hypothetical protein CSA49_04085 [Gammaproteobacteria bacterium]|nr:MAG: hypothetical protein CSA49_04085 [Gammaproteobacteria bacterium]